MVQLIIKNKHTIKGQTDAQGWNVLHYCARYDRLEILDMLCRKFENNNKMKGSALDKTEKLKIPEFIMDYAEDRKGNCPLHIACKYGQH